MSDFWGFTAGAGVSRCIVIRLADGSKESLGGRIGMYRFRKSKVANTIAGIILIVLLLVGIKLVVDMKQFLDAVPKIHPKESVMVPIGQIIPVDALVEVEKSVETKIVDIIEGEKSTDAAIVEGGSKLHVGTAPVSYQVVVEAVGSNHERKLAEVTVNVYVE